jgi:hypothetical protein
LSFLCGGFITAIPAIICGHVGRSSIRKSNGTLGGTGMATTGLVLGYLALILSILIGILLLVFGLPAVIKARQEAKERATHTIESTNPSPSSALPPNSKDLASTDGNVHFRVPNEWQEIPDLNKAASVQAGNKATDEYLMVISESKANLEDMTLQKHHQVTHDGILKRLENSSGTASQSLTLGGHPALQDELSGKQGGNDVVFLHTTVDDGENFHQILAWTLKSKWPEQSRQLRDITQSFRSSQ